MCDYIIVHIITNHHSKLDQYTSCFRSVLSQYFQNLAQIAVVEREMLVTRPGQSWTVSVERLLSPVLVSVRCVKPGNSRTESDRAGPGIDIKTKPARQDRTGKHYTPIDMVLSRTTKSPHFCLSRSLEEMLPQFSRLCVVQFCICLHLSEFGNTPLGDQRIHVRRCE